MKLNLLDFITDIEKAIKHLEYSRNVVNDLESSCRAVKDSNADNDWLDMVITNLDACDFDINTCIDNLKEILEGENDA